MATNLRLRHDAEDAVRHAAERTGRSQQEVIRAAIDSYLGLPEDQTERSDLESLVATGNVRAPRSAYRRPARRLRLPTGTTSADLLDRNDRL